MQNANLKFLSKPRILPKPKIFAKQEFYSPLACKHFRWPQLGRSAKKFIGLTLKCQLKRYPCCHLETKTAPFIGQKPPHSLCYLKMLEGNSNAKCKGPKNNLGGTNNNFIHPCKHFCWPQLGRSAKFIGLTLKCQIEEVPLSSLGGKNRPIHGTKTAPFAMLSKNVGRKFKCKMQRTKKRFGGH